MASADSIRAGKAHVEIGGDTSPLESTLRAIQSKIASWGAKVRNTGLAVIGAGLSITGPLVAAALTFSSVGDEMAKMASRTGVSVEALSELRFAADRSGASAEELETGLKMMSRMLGGAVTPDQLARLKKMGVSLEDLQNMTPDAAFEVLAEGIKNIDSPMEQMAAAMEIFGRSGTRLLPLFKEGADGIRGLRGEANRLGLTMSGDDAKAAEIFNDKLGDLKSTLKMVTFQVGAAVAPVLLDLIELVLPVVASIISWVKENKKLIGWLFMLGGGLLAIGSIVTGVGITLSAGAFAIAGLVIAAKAMLVVGIALVGTLMTFIVPILAVVAAGLVLWGVMYSLGVSFADLGEWIGELRDKVFEFFPTLNDLIDAFGGIKDSIAMGEWSEAVEIGWLALQLVFQRGKNWLLDEWLDLKFEMLAIWDSLLVALGPALLPVIQGIVGIFFDFIQSMQDVLNRAINAMPATVRARLGIETLDLTGSRQDVMDAIDSSFAPGPIREREVADRTQEDELSRSLADRNAAAAEHLRQWQEYENMRMLLEAQGDARQSPGSPMAMALAGVTGATQSSFSAQGLSSIGATSPMERMASGIDVLVSELVPGINRVGDLLEEDDGGVRTS